MRDSEDVKGAVPPPPPLPPRGQTPQRQGLSPELQAETDRLQANPEAGRQDEDPRAQWIPSGSGSSSAAPSASRKQQPQGQGLPRKKATDAAQVVRRQQTIPEFSTADSSHAPEGSTGSPEDVALSEHQRELRKAAGFERIPPGSNQIPVGVGVQNVQYKIGEVNDSAGHPGLDEKSRLAQAEAKRLSKAGGAHVQPDSSDPNRSGDADSQSTTPPASSKAEQGEPGAKTNGTAPQGNASPLQLSVVREAARAETLAAQDALDREALTKAVADLLTTRTDKQPLAVALFGAWGAGKSSFIEFVKKEVASRADAPFRYAEFNAWRNERVDNIGAALAQSVVESLVAERSFFEQVGLALKLAKRRNGRVRKALAQDVVVAKAKLEAVWEWLKFTLMYFAWPLAIGVLAVTFFVQTDAYKVVAGAAGAAATGLATLFSVKFALSKELLDFFKKLAKDQKFSLSVLPDYAEKLGSFHEMGRTLEDLCALTLANPKDARANFLLLVIDDLDRCSPDTIKQVFDAVRLMACIPQVVVLVALDERIAYSAVAKHYAEYGFSDRETAQVARDYMSKVFNVFVSLPAAPKAAIEKYVRTRLFDAPARGTVPGGASEHAITPPSVVRRPTETSSKLEAETFSALVNSYEMTNPRELWRLRQTWSLLKGFALPEHASDEEVRTWMRHMFFREMYLRGTAEQRKAGKPVLEKLATVEVTDSDVLWNEVLTTAARVLAQGFSTRDGAVMAVLLPAAPAEMKQSKA